MKKKKIPKDCSLHGLTFYSQVFPTQGGPHMMPQPKFFIVKLSTSLNANLDG